MLAGKQLKDSWLENADLLWEKEAKSQVANTCPSLAEETFGTRVCLSWNEDTMRIHHPLDLKETAAQRKGEIPLINSIQPWIFPSSFAESNKSWKMRLKDPDEVRLDGRLMCLIILPMRSPARFSFMLAVPNDALSHCWKEKYIQNNSFWQYFFWEYSLLGSE